MAKPKNEESMDVFVDETPEQVEASDRAARIAEANERASKVKLPALVSVRTRDPKLHNYGVRGHVLPDGSKPIEFEVAERHTLVDLLLDTAIVVEVA